jgi:hypothetical protein
MRTFLWVISIVVLVMIFPVMAVPDDLQPGLPLLDENSGMIAHQQNQVAGGEYPARDIPYRTTIQKLTFGQAVSLVTGGILGSMAARAILGRVLGRILHPDRLAFSLGGFMLGAVLGGQWCDKGLWPC